MKKVNITKLRSHLPEYLLSAAKGEEIIVTSHGKVIARIMPPSDKRQEAKKKLKELQKKCTIKDVTSPIDEAWDVEI